MSDFDTLSMRAEHDRGARIGACSCIGPSLPTPCRLRLVLDALDAAQLELRTAHLFADRHLETRIKMAAKYLDQLEPLDGLSRTMADNLRLILVESTPEES